MLIAEESSIAIAVAHIKYATNARQVSYSKETNAANVTQDGLVSQGIIDVLSVGLDVILVSKKNLKSVFLAFLNTSKKEVLVNQVMITNQV